MGFKTSISDFSSRQVYNDCTRVAAKEGARTNHFDCSVVLNMNSDVTKNYFSQSHNDRQAPVL